MIHQLLYDLSRLLLCEGLVWNGDQIQNVVKVNLNQAGIILELVVVIALLTELNDVKINQDDLIDCMVFLGGLHIGFQELVELLFILRGIVMVVELVFDYVRDIFLVLLDAALLK